MATVKAKLLIDECKEDYEPSSDYHWIGCHTICYDGFRCFLKRIGDRTSDPRRIWLTLTDKRKDEDDPDWWPLQYCAYKGLYLVGKQYHQQWEVPYVVDKMMARLEGIDMLTCESRAKLLWDFHDKEYWVKVEYS
jgi:hypothetical protein